MNAVRARLKSVLPGPVRTVLRGLLHYAQRLTRWGVILVQLRGETLADQLKLFVSAAAAPFISLRSLSRWQDPVLLFDVSVRVPDVGRFHLRQHTDDLWHVLPWREPEIHQALRNELRSGGTFVDAGANVGIYSVLASRLVGDNGRVVAIEMIPQTADILRRHLRLNGCDNAIVVEKALSNAVGNMVSADIPRGRFGQASIATERDHAGVDRILVETTTFDAVCAQLVSIDLLKMDLEGAETLALRGAPVTLPKVRRLIIEANHPVVVETYRSLLGDGFSFTSLGDKDLLAEARTRATTRS